MTNGTLMGRSILVVEDSPLISALLEDMLTDLGCTVIGPTGNMAFAVDLAGTAEIDAAVIDLNIRGGKVYPVADILMQREIPFVIASGYADWTMREDLKKRPRITKPFVQGVLEERLKEVLG